MPITYYGTIQGADEYALAIGNSAWAGLTDEAKTAALVRGSAYVDSYAKRYIDSDYRCWFTFIGDRTGGWAQARQWPRSGIPGLADNVTPVQIEYATYEAAIREATNPGSLNPDIDPASVVKREKVDVLEVEYSVSNNANGSSLLPIIPAIDSLLAPFLIRHCNSTLAIYTV